MDWELLYVALGGIGKAFSGLFGITLPFVNALLTLTTVFDLSFMCIPPVQSAMYKLFNGKRMGGFQLITRDMVNARDEALDTGQNIAFVYMKKRAWFYVYVVFIYYIVLGAGPGIMRWFLSYAKLLVNN